MDNTILRCRGAAPASIRSPKRRHESAPDVAVRGRAPRYDPGDLFPTTGTPRDEKCARIDAIGRIHCALDWPSVRGRRGVVRAGRSTLAATGIATAAVRGDLRDWGGG